ncbi:MAG: hypothetical protein EOO67_20145, partial [Microbacterium sp.]
MSAAHLAATADTAGSTVRRTGTIDVVVPVHNEERALVASVLTVLDHLATLPFPSRVTIADNASTDLTTR